MFGYIKPDTGDLKVREHELYKAAYCGLCRAQRKYTGLLSSLFLSYDFVFLYFLRAEILSVPTTFKSRRASFFRRDMRNVACENEQLVYCACAAAMLEYYKIKDDLHDERFLRRVASALLLPVVRHGLKKARKRMSLPEEELKLLLKLQDEIETDPSCAPGRAAEPSSGIFALFSSYGIDDELLGMCAKKIGSEVGIWLYLTDAADDLEADLKNRSFNPFAASPLRRDDLLFALDNHCERAELILRKLPVYDPGYRAILMNILTRGLHTEGQRVLNKETKQTHG